MKGQTNTRRYTAAAVKQVSIPASVSAYKSQSRTKSSPRRRFNEAVVMMFAAGCGSPRFTAVVGVRWWWCVWSLEPLSDNGAVCGILAVRLAIDDEVTIESSGARRRTFSCCCSRIPLDVVDPEFAEPFDDAGGESTNDSLPSSRDSGGTGTRCVELWRVRV